MRQPLIAGLLACLLLPIAGTAQVATAQETSEPDFQLSTSPIPGNPLEIDLVDTEDPPESPEACIAASGGPDDPDAAACFNVSLDITSLRALTDVTVTVIEKENLYVDPLVTTFAAVGSEAPATVHYAVRAQRDGDRNRNGIHTLTLEVTAPGAQPERISLPYLWLARGKPKVGEDTLPKKRLYGANFVESYPCGADEECTYRTSQRYEIVPRRKVSSRLAENGTNRCTRSDPCERYHYDRSTGLFQIGRLVIGRLTNQAAFIDNERYARMVYPKGGQRLAGTWHFAAAVDEGRGVVQQRLRLRSNGRFRLTYRVDGHRHTYGDQNASLTRKLRGRYRIGTNGRIALTDPRRGTTVATLALVATDRGKPRPATKGVWLDLPIDQPRGHSYVDGNRLLPTKPLTRDTR